MEQMLPKSNLSFVPRKNFPEIFGIIRTFKPSPKEFTKDIFHALNTNISLLSSFVRLQRGFLLEENKVGYCRESPLENWSSRLSDKDAHEKIVLAHFKKPFANGS